MINDSEIEAKAEELSIPAAQVEKDYVHSWVLWALQHRPKLRNLLVLKGGNALRKAYFAETRFSKDLDFSARAHVDPQMLQKELLEVCALVQAKTGIQFLDRSVVKDKDLPIPDVEALEARIYFKGFYNEEELTLKTQLDVTQFEKIYLPIQERPIIHGYSDSSELDGTIYCQKAEEIIASKLTTLLHRCKPSDLFDLLFSTLRKKGEIDRSEVVSTFLKKSIFGPQPRAAKEALLAVPLMGFAAAWATLVVPATTAFSFDFASDNFSNLIEALFAPLVATAIGGGGGRISRGMGASAYGGNLAYCSSNSRAAIFEAARSHQMIEMEYDGYRRLVEPYRFEYYIRKRDGVGSEYFWGWDNSGGKSGKAGIKMFFADKIRRVALSGRSFTPRYPVEI